MSWHMACPSHTLHRLLLYQQPPQLPHSPTSESSSSKKRMEGEVRRARLKGSRGQTHQIDNTIEGSVTAAGRQNPSPGLAQPLT